mmetsp:Transcript_13206/g.33318  ORF Transcript_13206/g.33318 Transcript_13206/m.33318 type:complete len:282 (-) Transcript_13206:103-948(-)
MHSCPRVPKKARRTTAFLFFIGPEAISIPTHKLILDTRHIGLLLGLELVRRAGLLQLAPLVHDHTDEALEHLHMRIANDERLSDLANRALVAAAAEDHRPRFVGDLGLDHLDLGALNGLDAQDLHIDVEVGRVRVDGLDLDKLWLAKNDLRRWLGTERIDPWEHLPLQELQGGTAAGAAMRHLGLGVVLLAASRGVATADDGDNPLLRGLHHLVHERLGALLKRGHLKDAHWSIPDDGLGLGHHLRVEFHALLPAVQSHEAVGDAVGLRRRLDLPILAELG